MKKMLSLFAALAVSGAAQAQFLEMEYCYEQNASGGFDYEFTVHTDAGWVAGMGWRWFIFGDAQSTASPFIDFVIDPASLPVGPWTSLSSSGGFHNGPTFSFVLDYWIPSSGTETLTWKGTSFVALDEPNMLFSTIAGQIGGAGPNDFKVAKQIKCGGGGCYADCDGSGSLDFFDFLCFQNEFAAGCP